MSIVWVAAKIVVPLAAAAAIDEGFKPYDASVVLQWCGVILVLSAIAAVRWLRWYSAFTAGTALSTSCGRSCSRTSSSCTSATTTTHRSGT